MKSREELLREAAEHPERLVEYISALQEQLGQTGQELTVARQDLQHQQQHLAAATVAIHDGLGISRHSASGTPADALSWLRGLHQPFL